MFSTDLNIGATFCGSQPGRTNFRWPSGMSPKQTEAGSLSCSRGPCWHPVTATDVDVDVVSCGVLSPAKTGSKKVCCLCSNCAWLCGNTFRYFQWVPVHPAKPVLREGLLSVLEYVWLFGSTSIPKSSSETRLVTTLQAFLATTRKLMAIDRRIRCKSK